MLPESTAKNTPKRTPKSSKIELNNEKVSLKYEDGKIVKKIENVNDGYKASSIPLEKPTAGDSKSFEFLKKDTGEATTTKIFSKEKIQWTATRTKGTQQTYEIFQRNDIDWDYIRTSGDK
ncbi:hypothetical protein [Oceanirhabdus sp. W0125-5]|uniref:hypothetical protein n=1 Tax=Oceanirhabdus sp. W0125-5 TaxID=2999116 RepID=UPI0022F33156|nr:hypothetical protein [Oceanirhabdus sp. W0125-5]WBW96121.1 hypothetical protein OW730_20865 [Oceanirhabdus sp. W0125-5]